MLNLLKKEANKTRTENGAVTYGSTMSHCLDLFSTAGALRSATEEEILRRFTRAYAENPSLAMKILFFARDIRGGLGERRLFRTVLGYLGEHESAAALHNLDHVAEYGRYDDLLTLMDTPCQRAVTELIAKQLQADLAALEADDSGVSLLAKWLPSVNASNAGTVAMGKKIARALGMSDAAYRKTLSRLRRKIAILENHLREKDYTFSYAKQPSRAMFKYRRAFLRNDEKRYLHFIKRVKAGEEKMNTGALYPYEIITPCLKGPMNGAERAAMDATWSALPDYTTDEDALVVVDGSGSMYCNTKPSPASVALSLGLYFAERNKGAFQGHFITFSERPCLVEIKGKDLYERVKYCMGFNEVANTNIEAVFELILQTAVKNHLPQKELPSTIYLVSDMEFDCCAKKSGKTNFENAKKQFAKQGYKLPQVVFWNVASRLLQQPVTQNEQGVALVSGCTPRLFQMVMEGALSPYQYMLQVLENERYRRISA